MGNSFGFAGHIRDKLGIHRPVHVLVTDFKVVFVIKQVLSWYLMCFHSQYSYLENFKCSSRATLRCLAGRMWPAGRALPRPDLGPRKFTWAHLIKQMYHWKSPTYLACSQLLADKTFLLQHFFSLPLFYSPAVSLRFYLNRKLVFFPFLLTIFCSGLLKRSNFKYFSLSLCCWQPLLDDRLKIY